ncbi:hypothetical protein EIB75_07845 [Epilithonimonas vandammei]|uniref:Uncharacterized protein n=1 Tax=Epilithonimonas vandammei TaxID=2487072 RepID=A0A3G8ZD62_9FLAO|nr:hypothetical protein [Epilithonimonas vandammei]AZI55158.1 hypothetical protein EIB75_07845 [Epilithonimonas vandammei]
MENFSLLVRKKIESLDSEQKLIFNEEYNRRKQPFGDDFNSDIAMEILRDIAITFESPSSIQKIKDVGVENSTERKSSGNSTRSPANKKSNGSYLFNYIYVLIIAFIGLSAYTKPTKVKMENDIINKVLETQPKYLSFFKNVFLGEEITEEKADTLIYNFFKNNGYEIYFKDYDWWIMKRFEIAEKKSDKSLLVAYGFLGKTFIVSKANDLEIDFNKNKVSQYNDSYSKPQEKLDYEDYEKIDDASNYKDYDKSNFDEKPVREESKTPNFLRKRGKSTENKLKSELTEDSIKI